MMRGVLSAAALVLVSCGESTTRLELALTINEECNPEVPLVTLLSVEVYGADQGSLCALARRCVSVNEPQGLDDLEDALRAARQPLIDVESSGIQFIVITGHATNDCFNFEDRTLCGTADPRDAADGSLPINLLCHEACSSMSYPLCP